MYTAAPVLDTDDRPPLLRQERDYHREDGGRRGLRDGQRAGDQHGSFSQMISRRILLTGDEDHSKQEETET
ncbi:hypothetical protein [Pseudonocardia xinjiangensis]|uniref:Uncharacterized protein n=1 Tax=Pseudonocardia xinjiangensis TaxID=75289 RepID=A0ABX1RBS1_9PSEU|nr:hypothetical protein [Pseudonocardia xinjiangensis]NMH77836.1 hypothetical protein [Pseudonocardia xinjiangensis]